MKRVLIGLILSACVFAACGRREGGGISSRTGGWPPSSSTPEVSSSAQVVKVSTSPVEIAANGSTDALVTLSISPGYHVNANPATFSYLIATEITPGKADGIIVGKPAYPNAEKRKFQFAEEPLGVYEGETQIKLPIRADTKAATGSRPLPISVRVQACDNEKCYPPASVSATIPIEVK
jgi:thiol:disulfide interchange protein DsbD